MSFLTHNLFVNPCELVLDYFSETLALPQQPTIPDIPPFPGNVILITWLG